VADADKSLAKRRTEIRQKDDELAQIHERRMNLTTQVRKFKNNGDAAAMPAIMSKKITIQQKTVKTAVQVVQKKNKKSLAAAAVKKAKKRPPPPSSSSSNSSNEWSEADAEAVEDANNDLRLRLEKKKKLKSAAAAAAASAAASKRQKKIMPSLPEVKKVKKNAKKRAKIVEAPAAAVVVIEKKAEVDDAELELIRQRALASMFQRQNSRRLSGENSLGHDKKILIPLNEETSDDDDLYDDLEAKQDSDFSLSSAASNGGLRRKETPLSDPKFIVTLDGINSSYFKEQNQQKSAGQGNIQIYATATRFHGKKIKKTFPKKNQKNFQKTFKK
jgi:hypothetical protein